MTWVKKEWLELSRQYKFLAIAFAFVFFAIFEPLMIKLLPFLLGGELKAQGIDISLLVSAEASAGIQGFIGDVYQIIPIVLAFAFGNYFSKEITKQTVIIPLTKGGSLINVFLSKILVLVVAVIGTHFLAGTINFMYSNVIFSESPVAFSTFILNHFYSALVLMHFISMLMLVDVWISKGFVSSLVTLGYFFILFAAVGFMGDLGKFTPLYLTKEASMFSSEMTATVPIAIASTVLWSILAITLSLAKLKNMKPTP